MINRNYTIQRELGEFEGLKWVLSPSVHGVALMSLDGGQVKHRFWSEAGFSIAQADFPEVYKVFQKVVGQRKLSTQAKNCPTGLWIAG